MREKELSKPVADWLRKEGFVVYSEIPYGHRCIDMVGLKEGAIRVVELKVRFTRSGIRQCVQCQLATSDVYLAIANRPLPKTIEFAQKYGIGLLYVKEQVELLLRPHKVVDVWRNAAAHLRNNCIEPSDIAGVPCMSGCGPAVAVAECIKQYVEDNPGAGWKEIFEKVPNHYKNHKSMRCAMTGYLGLSLQNLRQKANR